MTYAPIHQVKPSTLKANVTEILRELIINGTLAPDEEFNQAQIAERLGVSRGPIREALGQLEQEGLVQSVPYKGVVVTPLTRKYLNELYSVRAALEVLGLEYSVDRMGPAELDSLNRILDDMRAAARSNDLNGLVAIDLRFHEFLIEQADHELLLRMWRTLEVGMRRALRTRHQIYTFLDQVVGSHPTLVTALERRDKVLAQQIMREHIAESLSHLLKSWQPEEEGVALVENAAAANAD